MKRQFVVSLVAWVFCSLTALVPVAQASSIVLVSSYGNNSVLEYDATTGVFIKALVPSGYGGLHAPDGILIGPDGNLYVANSDGGPAGVLRYNIQTGAFMGKFVSVGNGAGNFTDMVYGPKGDLFVSDYGQQNVKEYNGKTGAFISVFASGNLFLPQNLTFGPDGNLYVAGEKNVVKFNGATGNYITTFVTNVSGGLIHPTGLSFGPNGNLFVGDTSSHDVLEYNGKTGAFIADFIPPGSGGLSAPHTIVFRGEVVYVPDTVTNQILEYNASTGAFITAFVPPGSGGLSLPTNLLFTNTPTPEPSSFLLLGPAFLGISRVIRRRQARYFARRIGAAPENESLGGASGEHSLRCRSGLRT